MNFVIFWKIHENFLHMNITRIQKGPLLYKNLRKFPARELPLIGKFPVRKISCFTVCINIAGMAYWFTDISAPFEISVIGFSKSKDR